MDKLISHLIENGIYLSKKGDKLNIEYNGDSISKDILEEIRNNKEELLKYLAADETHEDYQDIIPLATFDSYEVSSAQRRLWVLSQLGDGLVAYNMPNSVYLNQAVDGECLARAVDSTLERHEILRTVFREDERGEIRQWVLKKEDLGFKIDYQDFRKNQNKEELVKTYIHEDTYKAFDLVAGPIFRIGLLQLEEFKYVFYYNMHHIISDGWSLGILRKDVFEYYKAYKEYKQPELKPLRIQYKDYSAWQLTQMEQGAHKLDRAYWLESLNGELPVLNLPALKQRPRIKTNNGFGLGTYIGPEVTGKLRRYSENKGGSLFIGLVATWNALMHQYTSQRDIIIGTPVAGRNHADLEDQIGFYLNTLALRNEIRPEDSFDTLFSRVKQNTLTAYSHQMYPFDSLVEELDIQRDASRSAVFDVIMVLQNTGKRAEGLDPIAIGLKEEELNRIEDEGYSISRFDMEIAVNEVGDCLMLHVVFNPDVYAKEMVEGLIRHYKQLLNALLKNTQEKLSQIDYLSAKEKHQLLIVFNDTEVAYPRDKTIVDLFQEQAEKTPNNVAVVFEENKLTYRELHEQSNQLAYYLQTHYSIQPDDLIGVKLNRSERMVVSILGILKSGGAYVPIDPEYPQEGIGYIEKDTRCKLWIDEKELEKFQESQANYSTAKVDSPARIDNLAYVMYTSGSTGQPKGVMIEHGSVVRLVKNANFVEMSCGDKILGLSNFVFDGSTFDVFMPLLNGGELVISSKDVFLDIQKLDQIIGDEEIDGFFLTTALFNSLVDAELKSLAKLKYLLFGGEQVSVKHVKEFKKLYPAVKIHHVYGPTENTTFSTWYAIESIEAGVLTIPIGSGISNSTAYILDESCKMVPVGVIGEICVGGAGLARGYLNQEELTGQKFIENPFKEGERIYKTGDLGRWLPDGNIEFIGRKDDQVKIRGYRIELGEIEHALLRNEKIKEAVVIVKANENKEKELVAYITSKEEQNTSALRSYLKELLPEYMVPAYFVQLEVMPLNANGKIDKRSLPDPQGMNIESGIEYIAPRSELEEKLVKIWENVLQRKNIGVKDDFFELGGHSLKAVRLNNEYGKELSVKLSLKDLFAYPSIELQAALIGISKKTEFTHIEKVAQQESYPISDAQRRLWVLDQFAASLSAYNISGSTYLNQDIDIDCFKRAIDSVIERHEILRTVFKVDEKGETRQWVLKREDLGFNFDYRDFRRKENKQEKVQSYINEDAYKPFDLVNGPLLRAALLRVENKESVFYFNMHHIISDGWSMEVLSRDVFAYYEAYKENKKPVLKELHIQYKDYSAWSLEQIKEKSFKAHRDFWINSLKGELPLLNLPSTKQRPRLKNSKGHGLSGYINGTTTHMLKTYTHANGGSLFMGLLTVWNVLMYRYTSQKDIIIGSPIAGREHADLEDQIGFYVNMLALRNEIDPEQSFDALFSKVKQNTLQAYSHQVYPFDRLVEELTLQRATSRSAVFDVMLILQNNEENVKGLELEEGEINRIVDLGSSVSKFDIEVTLRELGDHLSIHVVYNPDVYEQGMMENLIIHYKQLLHALLESPEGKISQTEYLSQEEKQLLNTFNATEVNYPKEKTIVDLLEEQAEKTPENIAVVFEEKELTYRELHEQSNQLAHYLQRNYAVKPDDLIGIKQERSAWMLISILGILKAGGAYVPIDPADPQERMDYIEEDTKCKVCIDEKELINFKEVQQNYSTEKVSSGIRSNNLIYVIYTSGSTGRPKGVLLEHSGVVNRLLWMGRELKVDTKDVFLQKTPTVFDVSVWELFLPLVTGSKLVVARPESHKDPVYLEEIITNYQVSIIHFVPSALSSILENIQWNKFESLRHVICSGEALTKKLEQSFKEKCMVKLHNYYGPTEASIDVTTINLTQFPTIRNDVLIGKPVDNTSIYIVNEMNRLQAVGILGEILIGGVQVARGYLNKEELTNEKFIISPFKKGERLYRTGDLGRWLTDGNIEYIGRKDDQVKIRGYRIELGEIEHALQSHKDIREVAVLVKENEHGEKELVAYITGKVEKNAGELRSYLKGLLPEYMVPVYFVQLDSLPLINNGKIDKKSLPDPKSLGISSGVEYVSARNEQEERLVKIWEEILQRENIGVKDDFFALGGHSLKAVRLSNGYQKELQVKLSLKALYTYTSIESHVELIRSSKKTEFIQIEPVALQASYPISDAQRRLWVLSQFEDSAVAYIIPGNAYLNQDVDVDCFKRAINSVIDRHEVLRTVFRTDEKGEIRQWILKREDLGFKIDYRDFRDENNKQEKIKEHIAADSYKLFDFVNGPLLRAGLLQLEDNEYLFYYNIHHTIGDGWSLKVLSEDIFKYYEAYKEKKEPDLKPLRIQYKDYSAWQLAQLKEESYNEHRGYWLNKLDGELPLLDFPSSKKRPDVKTHNGRTVVSYLNKPLTGKLKKYALEREGTLFMGIMSALKALLYRYTGQQDLILGMQVAGRDHSDLEDQIGFYVNSLALRNEINGEDSFEEVYQKVRHSILEAYTHQVYPFDRLVEELEQSRLTSRSAVFDVTVVLQNTGEKIEELLIPEEKIDDIIEYERGTCIYDIKFDFQEEGDYLRMTVEYNKDVYEAEMIEGFMRHYKAFTELALLNSSHEIKGIDYLSEAEKQQLIATFNHTQAAYPQDKTIIDLFHAQVKNHKQNAAVVYGNTGYSYEELNRRSNQVAHFLLKEAGIKKEEKIGLLLNPGLDTIASMLGVLKAGGAYVPLDAGLPEDRLSFMISDVGMRVLITEKEYIEPANRLQWGVGSLENYLCIDSNDVKSESEHNKNEMMSQELWDHVGEKALDQVAGGGWVSSYTGQDIAAAEMEEYSMNAYKKLKSSLHSGMRVLEIGCSSGLTLSKVAPEVGFYYGTDLSAVIISNTKKLIAEKGLRNVKLKHLAAHEISTLEEGDFDLIIINSVIQSFHGHNYLLKVIRDSTALLKEEGRIFIGDVMDLNKKTDLIEDLEDFKRSNTDKGYTTKTDFSSELFVSRGYFEDLQADEKEIANVEISEKIRTIENELTRFRYDAVLHIDKRQTKGIGKVKGGKQNSTSKKHKWQYSRAHLDSQVKTNPKISISADQLVYIIYTSGTTGRPKGVMVEHGSLMNYLSWALSKYPGGSLRGFDFGLFTSLSFDLTVSSIYLPLLSGGSLSVFDTKSDISAVLTTYFQSDISCIKLTPAHISLLKDLDVTHTRIEVAVVGGEALTKTQVEVLKKLNPLMRIYNEYGPTESTVGCIVAEITSIEEQITIGQPIANTQIYIVNENEGLQPKGVVGELCIGGEGLSRGYLNQVELTREKFIVNPFKAGERIYKTGDLGRWLPDGNIEFIGRKDDQVKIRGYRIELGEIEHALQSHLEIDSAVVLAKENKQGEKELVAYITSKEEQNTSELRSYLKELLPEYMVPAYFVQLEAMPLTSNGKVDKRSLPDPKGLGLSSGVEYVAPRNAIEKKLVKIWEGVLQRENIGIKDDFFALGGHSLKAVRLSNAYVKELSVKISLKDLFAHTSIESHVALISSSKKIDFIQIEPVAIQESYPISDAQRRLWVLSQFENGSVAYNSPASIVLEKSIDIGSFKRAIDSTIERHEILRTVFKEDTAGAIRQWILKREDLGFKIDYKDYRKEKNKDEKVKEYITADSYKAFDLEQGSLLRAGLLQVEDEEYIFYYNMHHIISDGWSMEVLSKDVMSYYDAYKENKEPALKPLRIQYKDYSAWQLSQLVGEAYKSHRDYWLKSLEGELPLLDLPGIKQRPDVKTHNGRTVVTYLNKDITQKLKEYALMREGTLFMGIVAALKALLYRYTGQEDIILGMQIAGRNHSDLEDQIGFYVNSLALRNKISGRDSFEQVYQKVRHSVLEAYTHQVYPFDRLVEELEQRRLTSRSAVFDMTVVLQNTGEKIKEMFIPEERIDDIIELEIGTCKFDVKFDFQEVGDYLCFLVEYNKDVYEAEIIEAFIRHFKEFTSLVLLDPMNRVNYVNYLPKEDQQKQLAFLIGNKVAYAKDKTIIDLFQEQVKKHKENAAVVYGGESYSYDELNRRSNQVAHFLLKEAGIKKEEKIGLLLNPGLDTIASMLGVLKAGGAYVPLDAGLPEDRLSFMISDVGMRVLITEKEYIEPANRLQWGVESLANYLCIDSDDVRSESEHHKNEMMSQELWDHVGEKASDPIAGGGWVSSYTGQDIAAAEMEEYSMNAYKKLESSLHSGMRVLEIGCSSGLTLNKIAPEVGFYYGTDLSLVIISNTKKLIAEKGLRNVKLKQLAAHGISSLEEVDFDLIIINSVIQSFHGHNYLLKVIRDSIALLKEAGRIFIGDVMDLNKKTDLIKDLEAFKRSHTDKGYTTKTDFSSELFVSRGYFEDLQADEKEIAEVRISEKIGTIENELTRFRYDAILHIDKRQSKKISKVKGDKQKNKLKKHKWQYSRDHLDSQAETNPKISISADHLAYIIYTSGTTGRPKGVMVEHGNVVRLFKNDTPLYDFSSSDVWTKFHSYAFDYSTWQLSQLEKESFKAHQTYWLNNLKGELPLLDLPGTKHRTKIKTHDGRTLRTYLNKELSQKLKRYSEINGGTAFMGLLAAWNVLMCRYTSQADIIVGTSIAGREHADLDGQIGFYINTLALRNAINPEENFDELFSRVKHSTLNAYSHQMYPFDRLVEELNLIRDTSRSAVFDILLDFHNTGEKIKNIELGKAETDSIVDAGKQLVKYDLELHFTEVGDYILIQVNYNEDVYEKQVVEDVIAHYKRLMVELIDNSSQCVGGINFLSDQEKNQLILEFNDTEVDYPKDKTILDLFEEQVGKTPDAAVIRNGDKALSYKELDELSNQFAHCLIKNCQVKASDIVGIKLDKGDWSVISILGVLKTGAGYVPIDPEYPSLRKQHILSESKIKLLITDTNYLFDNDEFDGSVFAVDVEFDKEVHSKERVNLIQSSASLAYVIYTSGSTGNPKGVMIDHASLMNYLIWARSAYRHTSLAGLDFGLFSSLSFDLTVTSLYLPLISGGALTVFDSSSDISSVLKTYFESDISCIKLTPAHISLLKTLEIEKTQVQTVIVGGDKLENTQVAILKKLNRDMRIYNEYGPTESTVGCIIKEIVSEKEDILIGKPISNTQIYILSPEGSVQPVGVIGEICVGGAGLARGYLNQEELTGQKFIENPFKEGERIYKTGDLGRWLPDGNIEFIGRKDDQVKIRGYRIELGEIEHALLRNEKIKEAVVIVKANENKEKELVVYFTASAEQNVIELRYYLKELLPEYMLPSYYVQLEAMPLTSNGKVDKKSLPDPQGVGLASGGEYVAPRNEIEEKLVKIWQEVLQRENIGIKDDFFALGGHSLKAIRLSNEYQKELQVKLSLKDLFAHTSMQSHADLIGIRNWIKGDSGQEEPSKKENTETFNF